MSQNTEIRNEGMRIGGEIVFTDAVIEVKYPYRAMQFTPAPTRYSIYPVPIETITHNI